MPHTLPHHSWGLRAGSGACTPRIAFQSYKGIARNLLMSYKNSLFMATKGFRTVYDLCDNPLFNWCQDRWSEEGKITPNLDLSQSRAFYPTHSKHPVLSSQRRPPFSFPVSPWRPGHHVIVSVIIKYGRAGSHRNGINGGEVMSGFHTTSLV